MSAVGHDQSGVLMRSKEIENTKRPVAKAVRRASHHDNDIPLVSGNIIVREGDTDLHIQTLQALLEVEAELIAARGQVLLLTARNQRLTSKLAGLAQ